MQYQRGSIGLFFRGDPTLGLYIPFEQAGTDYSKSGNHLIPTGTFYYRRDFIPYIFGNLNGSNYLAVPSNTAVNLPSGMNPWTLMFWFKKDENFVYTSRYLVLIQFGQNQFDQTTAPRFNLDCKVSDNKIGLFLQGASRSVWTGDGNTNVCDSKWHLITIRRDTANGKIELRIDLSQEIYADDAAGSLDNFDNFTIGMNDSTLSPGNVYLGQVALFNRLLSIQEIAQYYRWATSSRPKYTLIFLPTPANSNFFLFFNN